MRLRGFLLAATVLAVPAAVYAQPVDGLYIGAGVGYNYKQDQKVHGPGAGIGDGKLSGNGGFAGVASIGYGLGNGFRAEVEGNYRQQHDKLNNSTSATGSAFTETYGVMVNGLYDFVDLGLPVTPYLGAGVGWVWTTADSLRLSGNNGANFNVSNATRSSPAAQVIAGVAYPIDSMPGLSLTAEYRFMAAWESEKFKGTTTVSGINTEGKAKALDQYNHAFLIGARYAFNAAPPPPPPAPVPAPQPAAATRTYLVFFDWDRADLTDRARQIIAEAAQNAARVAVTKIDVSGHADRTGTAAYNQRLSLRRADAVAGELVRLGVQRNIIDIMAYGDTRPLVPTAAGVREPQNRRVEIVLH